MLIPSGVRPALTVWTAHLVFRLVLAAALRLCPRPTELPHRLLLLRVPGAEQHGEVLLHRLDAYWRHVGTISTIAGPELSSRPLRPHEFLNLLRGRPARRVLGTVEQLRRHVVDLDQDPDPDGRYRVDELFCHGDLRREALRQLLRRSDCILLDLRGFSRRSVGGVTEEITQVARLVPLSRVVVVLDDDTDQYFLRVTLDRARAGLDAVVPGPSGSLRMVRSHAGHVDTAAVVVQLGRAS